VERPLLCTILKGWSRHNDSLNVTLLLLPLEYLRRKQNDLAPSIQKRRETKERKSSGSNRRRRSRRGDEHLKAETIPFFVGGGASLAAYYKSAKIER
jgi:hypothetical protein